MTFLIVEDSRATRNLIKSYVNEVKLGQRCFFVEVESGEEAIKMIEAGHIDFVLLDWNLSTKMTGMDVLKQIRSNEKYKHIHIIIITGESDKANVIEAIKTGASDFISKPIDKKLFSEKILKVITS